MQNFGWTNKEYYSIYLEWLIILPTPFTHEREAIVQFDWLGTRQSKNNLAFGHNGIRNALNYEIK